MRNLGSLFSGMNNPQQNGFEDTNFLSGIGNIARQLGSTLGSPEMLYNARILGGSDPVEAGNMLQQRQQMQMQQQQMQMQQEEVERKRQAELQRQMLGQKLAELGLEDPSDVQGNFIKLVNAGLAPAEAITAASKFAELPFAQQQSQMKLQSDMMKEAPKIEEGLRKEYSSQSKEFKDIARAYGKINKALTKENPSPADDMAAVYALIKLYDPNTGVREGEYAKAEQLKGVPDWLRSEYNKAVTGNFLTPKIRGQINSTAKDLYEAERSANTKVKDQFKAITERSGANPANVLLDYDVNPKDIREVSPEIPKALQGKSVEERRMMWEQMKREREGR